MPSDFIFRALAPRPAKVVAQLVAVLVLAWLLPVVAPARQAPPHPPQAQSVSKALDPAIEAKANAGDPMAQFLMGDWIDSHVDMKDPVQAQEQWARAAAWYKKAADQGYSAAENNLGAMYVDGRGVPPDPQQAGSYYRRAIQHGSHESETNLAILVLRKRIAGTPDEAIGWLKSASDAGFAPAQTQMAQIYLNGIYLAPDDATAANLFHRAAEQGDPWGEYGYALMLQSGTGVARNLQDAETWMERAANANVPPAMFDLSRMLELGLGVPADKKRSDALLKRAAQLGEQRAQQRLGIAAPAKAPS
jgi:TPR repeat protein